MKFWGKIKKKFSDNKIIIVFMFFVIIILILGCIYIYMIFPDGNKVQEIIEKFRLNDYELPYFIAERYLTWYNMRTYFFALHYILTLCGLFASFMTIFYASKNGDGKEKEAHNKKIVFLSLFSTCFTVSSIFIKPESMAYMSQHAWRQLDNCIMEVVNDNNIPDFERNEKIISKLIEIEQYIESYEH